MNAPEYAELVAATNYSFLHGASHPHEMVQAALYVGLNGIGIADRNSVAGVVRAHVALRELQRDGLVAQDFRLVVGARLLFVDGTPDIVAYPVNRRGWGRLTSLLTRGNLRAIKGQCILRREDLLGAAQDMQLIVLPASTASDQVAHKRPVDFTPVDLLAPVISPRLALVQAEPLGQLLAQLTAVLPCGIWLGATMTHAGSDERRIIRLRQIAQAAKVPLLAVNDALYAGPSCRPLQDVLTAIRLSTTVAAAGRSLLANAERHIKAPEEMARLFAPAPEAVTETQRFLSGISFTLDDLRYEYPHEPVPPGWEPQAWLEHLVEEAALARYGEEVPPKVVALLKTEFTLIRAENYACYFLTVHDIVRYARSQGILCQGRGSAANSAVCFLLGVTSVDPMQHDLLFSRFMSSERKEPPDIDVDFEHERREEVMQYIYRRYGRERAGIAATVIHYRPRSALREVGKALGLPADITSRMASTVWGSHASRYEQARVAETGFDPDNPEIARLTALVGQVLEFPRHLSQHVGGFVLTQDRLDETVPIHHGAMPDRSFIEWDKDDIDALGLMKVDVLALGMLTCIRKSFDLMRAHDLGDHTLEVDIACEDPAVYEMLCKGDSVGVFQVESRAQMNMLPRLKPEIFYDLVVQVAIVRPGPIEGDMVHPYLRRRAEKKFDLPGPTPPHPPDELADVLGKTYGVPIFQEQAMKLAIVAASFSDAEANQLRRAMATFRSRGGVDAFHDKMVGGMVARGYDPDFAARCFKQIEGFGSYGFPESHAQSFARLVYVSSWLKCHQPAVFTCALLNSQPMGFYAPAQLVRDAREHGVDVRPVDVNHSEWDNTLEPFAVSPLPLAGGAGGGQRPHATLGKEEEEEEEEEGKEVPTPAPSRKREGRRKAERGRDTQLALRLGLRQITGFRREWADALILARAIRPFTGIEDIARSARLPNRALRLLADADALTSLELDRRTALWEARRVPAGELPLFAAAQALELGTEPAVALAPLSLGEQVAADYQNTRLSLKAHPMALLRPLFPAQEVMACAQLRDAKDGARVTVAGVVLIRQRPGKGNAIFITIEDEDAIANIVLWASDFEKFRRPVMAARLMVVEGQLQRSKEGVLHVMASRIIDRSELLGQLSELDAADPLYAGSDDAPHARHPRQVRLLPRSRDFH